MSRSYDRQFRIALTGDFVLPDGSARYPHFNVAELSGRTGVVVSTFAEHRGEIEPAQIGDAAGVIVLTPRVTADSVSASENLLAVGRFGVGYDTVDVSACTAADVAVFIAAGAVDRPVAEAAVGWMIALSHRMFVKDRLVRRAEWDQRAAYMGRELRDRTLGIVGLGGIGRELVRLLAGFGMRTPLAHDPYIDAATAETFGVRLVSLERLLAESDFVSLHCPLNERTRGLIGAAELALMKPDAYLINTARGGIVDEPALYDALAERRIAGAAIDCFVDEPLAAPPRLAELDNVILAPHSIAWTEELFRDIGRAVCRGMLDLVEGRRPAGIVNPEVFDRAGFREKWTRLKL